MSMVNTSSYSDEVRHAKRIHVTSSFVCSRIGAAERSRRGSASQVDAAAARSRGLLLSSVAVLCATTCLFTSLPLCPFSSFLAPMSCPAALLLGADVDDAPLGMHIRGGLVFARAEDTSNTTIATTSSNVTTADATTDGTSSLTNETVTTTTAETSTLTEENTTATTTPPSTSTATTVATTTTATASTTASAATTVGSTTDSTTTTPPATTTTPTSSTTTTTRAPTVPPPTTPSPAPTTTPTPAPEALTKSSSLNPAVVGISVVVLVILFALSFYFIVMWPRTSMRKYRRSFEADDGRDTKEVMLYQLRTKAANGGGGGGGGDDGGDYGAGYAAYAPPGGSGGGGGDFTHAAETLYGGAPLRRKAGDGALSKIPTFKDIEAAAAGGADYREL